MYTLIWQDIVLIIFVVVFLMRMSYNWGNTEGRETERFRRKQADLEKSGNFFWSHGVRIPRTPYPPRLKSTRNKQTIKDENEKL